jgi:hypothetical protein
MSFCCGCVCSENGCPIRQPFANMTEQARLQKTRASTTIKITISTITIISVCDSPPAAKS